METVSATPSSEQLAMLRVDQVGSLLRPPELLDALRAIEAGEITEQQLDNVRQEAIADVVAKQVRIGLPVITDGEFPRLQFMESFSDVRGFEGGSLAPFAQRQAPTAAEDGDPSLDRKVVSKQRVVEPISLVRNRPLDWFRATQALTTTPVKASLVGPDRLAQRYDEAGSKVVYASTEEFLEAVVRIEREIIAGLVAAGCRYVQIDAPSYTAYVDKQATQEMRAAGLDPMDVFARSIEFDNAVIDGFTEVTFGIHICRGNRRSHWHREGSYDDIAEKLFGELRHHRILLEYDTERAGTFEPLRFLSKDTIAVLGLITTKTGRVEEKDELKRRLEAASQYAPIEQLALSPQCGFASSFEGNLLTENDQWRKFEVMLETAEEVWG